MVGQAELAIRILVTAVVVVAPALCFLGMWRGLKVLRDDALIARVQERGGLDPSSASPGFAIPALQNLASSSTVRCRSCDTVNTADATYCQQCLEQLPRRS